jgi:pimeloyl-ACP methyl ester carboxylesterase
MREHEVRLDDGRRLTVREDGDPDGRPVFRLHGTPGSRLLYPPHVADARRRGIRLIGYDRPGYGGSTARRGRRVGDVAPDVAAVADQLGIDRFAVWGHSGGGAPAIACAARLPGRVVAATSLAGVAPPGAEGLDPLEGMGEANREDVHLMLSDPAAWEAKLQRESIEYARATPEQLQSILTTLLSEVDRAALTPELVSFFVEEGREGLRHGADGMRDDNLSDTVPWGFDLSSVRCPLQIWHGAHDRFVPFAHGQWLAAHLPRAEPHLLPDAGHLGLLSERIPEVHAWLLAHF